MVDYNNKHDWFEFIKRCLKPLVEVRYKYASPFETKAKINGSVWKDVGVGLEVYDERHFDSSNKMCVHPDNAATIARLYDECIKSGAKTDNLTIAYAAYNSAEAIDLPIAKNLVREFVKHNEIHRDVGNNKREKILKNNVINSLLAIDGFCGTNVGDVYNYVGNLRIGRDDASTAIEKHVAAVGKLYASLPENMTGTDSAHFVLYVLLKQFQAHISDLEVRDRISVAATNSRDYLVEKSKYFAEIDQVLNSVETYASAYESAVQVADVAHEKVEQFVKFYKNRNVNSGESAGSSDLSAAEKRRKRDAERRKKKLEEQRKEQEQQGEKRNHREVEEDDKNKKKKVGETSKKKKKSDEK